ncbi:hypothetical protein CBS147333_1536 [Penicillium roqueforti]|nr:hypothetical protein CBS147333_1536 [Penicillium roqueforti]KAI3202986.1 hypothetical protein CBS147311_4579 [Penicillium roqueforti]KAI3279078.1 hypothetical protein CBS147308_419 [Penicillium roqueforti]KAI3293149.1 hypothetical protein DTO003C3_3449 [Penicillium roqueforti]
MNMAPSIRSSVSRGKRPLEALHEEDLDQPGPATPTPGASTSNPTMMESIERDEITNLEEENLMHDVLRGTSKEERFMTLAGQYKDTVKENRKLIAEIATLHAKEAETTTSIQNLTLERDEAIAHLNLALQERDRYAYRLLNNEPATRGTPSHSGTPIVGAGKTTKMPDAPILKDGKEVRFETWETIIRQKLEANADHYPLPVHRKIYV